MTTTSSTTTSSADSGTSASPTGKGERGRGARLSDTQREVADAARAAKIAALHNRLPPLVPWPQPKKIQRVGVRPHVSLGVRPDVSFHAAV
ncbi:hypothetical protein [Geodermatophilus sp. SYSU D00815]